MHTKYPLTDASNQVGKQQLNNTLVITPEGFEKMKTLRDKLRVEEGFMGVEVCRTTCTCVS